MIKVLGIDPGTNQTGFGVVGKRGNHLFHIDSGTIKLSHKKTLSEKLFLIHQEISSIISFHKPEALVIEEAFYAQNIRSSMVLAHARGTVMVTGKIHNLPCFEYSALEVKRASTGYGRATKEQVFEMIKRLLNLQNEQLQSFDQSDALSIAICHLNAFDLQKKLEVHHPTQGKHHT